jgi:sugar-phosphatase
MTEFHCEAVLFDCDGVLVDSELSTVAAWTRWAHDFDIEPERVMAVMQGRRSEDTIAEFLPEPMRVAAEQRIDEYEIGDAASVRAIPGALELVRAMPRGCWAVVTSGNVALATARLTAAGLSLPEVLVTADDVSRGKPDPEGYRAAAARLGFDPSLTIVCEDAPAGIAAGRAAGVAAVIGVGPDGLLADAVVRDLTELSWTGQGLRVKGNRHA